VGVELLKQGAVYVVLCDHFILLDKERNLDLLPQDTDYLVVDNSEVKPLPQFITLLHGDIARHQFKVRGRSGKYLLKKAFAKELPESIKGHGKQGF
jgi:hypothetical protein